MANYKQFFFSGTLVHSSSFRLRLIRSFSDALFTRNKFLTEVSLAISGAHFSFATIFQYLKFVRLCLYSKLDFSCGCSLQWCKPFVDIFFHLREISKQTLGNIKKTGLILSSESVNMLIRGVVRPCAWSKFTPKALLLYSFSIHNTLFPLRFHFYTLLKLQLNCEFTILPFSGPY